VYLLHEIGPHISIIVLLVLLLVVVGATFFKKDEGSVTSNF